MSTILRVTVLVAMTLAAHARPNILLFMPDDMSFLWPEAPASTNNPGGITTNMDAVRSAGVVFTSAYTAGVQCAPARFALVSGRYCSRSLHARGRASSTQNTRVPISVPACKITGDDNGKTVATLLAAQGYRTIFAGKWHMASRSDWSDYAGSWSYVSAAGFTHDGGTYISNMGGSGFTHNAEWNVALSRGHIRDAVANNEEFFLYFAGTMPHGPSVENSLTATNGILQTPAGTLNTAPVSGLPSRTDILNFASTNGLNDKQLGTYVMDLALGALLDEVDAQGVTDNTMVICLMDHGMLDKPEITEGGIRIAMFAKYPQVFAPGSISAHVSNLDVSATILEAASISQTYAMDGQSWYGAAAGSSTMPSRYMLSEDAEDRAVVSPAGIKVVHRISNAGATSLYDLATDTGLIANGQENVDRSGEAGYATTLAELNGVLACHDGNTGWTPVADPQPDCHAASPSPPPPPPPPTDSPTPAPTGAALCCRDGSAPAATRPFCSSGRPRARFC